MATTTASPTWTSNWVVSSPPSDRKGCSKCGAWGSRTRVLGPAYRIDDSTMAFFSFALPWEARGDADAGGVPAPSPESM
jgi:hypothetical protein